MLHGKKDTKTRVFNNHAQRWKHGMKARAPGELVQVDHMPVYIPGFGYAKHFSATCPVTKYTVCEVYQEATSKNAAEFFEKMKIAFPFQILFIQVDGGSEFMAYFENACKKAKIPLFVLPLICILSGRNSSILPQFYNAERPHQGIGLFDPMAVL